MVYEPQDWQNLPDTTTPFSAERMLHIEQGIKDGDVTDPNSPARAELSNTFITPAQVTETVAPKLDKTEAASTYARLGVDSTQRLMALLKNETRDASMLVVGDSTGNETTEWVYRLAQGLGADWPKWTVNYRLWDDATTAYAPAVTVQTGAGTRTLTIWNASVAGAATSFWAGARANAALYALSPELTIVSLGHNEQVVAPEMWHSRYVALTETISWTLPGTDVLLIAQNPATGNTNQQLRAEVYREIAARRGYGFVDVGQAFLDTGDAGALTTDGIHPNTAGTDLWLTTVKAAFVYQPGGRRTAQPSSPLGRAGDNLLINHDFAAFGGTVPDNWSLSAGTAAKDTTNFESHTLDRLTSASTASTAVKFTASTAATTLHQYIPVKKVAGKWVTLAARVFVPVGQPSTVARFAVADSSGSTLQPGNAAGNGAFSWVVVSRFIPATATNCRVLIYVDSGTTGGNCTIDRVILVPGKYPNGK